MTPGSVLMDVVERDGPKGSDTKTYHIPTRQDDDKRVYFAIMEVWSNWALPSNSAYRDPRITNTQQEGHRLYLVCELAGPTDKGVVPCVHAGSQYGGGIYAICVHGGTALDFHERVVGVGVGTARSRQRFVLLTVPLGKDDL